MYFNGEWPIEVFTEEAAFSQEEDCISRGPVASCTDAKCRPLVAAPPLEEVSFWPAGRLQDEVGAHSNVSCSVE